MPDLMMFAPCRILSIDAITNQLSLNMIIESIQPVIGILGAPEDAPEHVRDTIGLLPDINLITQWWRTEADDGVDYEQRITIVAADGRESDMQPGALFTLSHPFHRIIHSTGFIGIRNAGTYQFKLYLRRAGEDTWGEPIATRPFLVEAVPEPVADQQ